MERNAELAINALTAGQCVVLPTETVYGLAARADSAEAIERLIQTKEREPKAPFTLAFGSVEAVRRFGVELNDVSSRLLERCLPGPLTLILPVSENSVAHALPETVKPMVCPTGSVGIRVPANDFTAEILRGVDFPVALTSANISGQADTTSAEEARQTLGSRVGFIFDGGPARLGKPSTVVLFQKNSMEYAVLRVGAISAEKLRQLSTR